MFISGEKLRGNKLLLTLFPKHSRRRILTWFAIDIILHPFTFFNHINIANIRTFMEFREKTIFCNVCGKKSLMVYSFPDVEFDGSSEMSRYRETLSCINCGATMRRRTIAHALLTVANSLFGESHFNSVEELADSGINIDILDTEDYSPLSFRLSRLSAYITSKYLPEKEMGIKLQESVYNINLEHIDFDSEKFYVIITSEVMEHV